MAPETKYMKKYRQSAKGIIAFRKAAKKYWYSDKGKARRIIYVEKNKEKLKEYNRIYGIMRRALLKKKGLCDRCKSPVIGTPRYTNCASCRKEKSKKSKPL